MIIPGEWTGNQDCLANRLIPAMKNVERMAAAGEKMANAIADVTPEAAAAVKSTSMDLAAIVKVTLNIVEKISI